MELELKKVTFQFADGSEKVLEGEELAQWEVICLSHSDYLLPGAPGHVLVSAWGGLVRGFMPKSAIEGG